MPLITDFKQMETTRRGALQPTRVVAGYKTFELDGTGPVFQVDTRGSESRKKKGAQSQTFQLDRRSAEALWRELGSVYGFK